MLTAAHQILKNFSRRSPRIDALGRQSVTGVLHALRLPQPTGKRLQSTALAGDLVANTLFYSTASLAGARNAPIVGSLLGIAAGLGALVTPGVLGLDPKATNRYPETRALTIGLYTLGGFAAGVAYREFR